MGKKDFKIYIVGAGVSGLVAAQVLENKGYHPIILEAANRAGGRVKTDIKKGVQLDHGFQVLLSSYPAAQKYLDFKAFKASMVMSLLLCNELSQQHPDASSASVKYT